LKTNKTRKQEEIEEWREFFKKLEEMKQ